MHGIPANLPVFRDPDKVRSSFDVGCRHREGEGREQQGEPHCSSLLL